MIVKLRAKFKFGKLEAGGYCYATKDMWDRRSECTGAPISVWKKYRHVNNTSHNVVLRVDWLELVEVLNAHQKTHTQ